MGLSRIALLAMVPIFSIASMGCAGASVLKSDPISGYDCEFLADHWTGKEVRAAFGSKSKVLKISQVTESSRGEAKLECTGIAVLSVGKDIAVVMSLFEDADGDRFFEFYRGSAPTKLKPIATPYPTNTPSPTPT